MEMTSKAKILVMFAKEYDMPPENGKDRTTGCTVNYYFFGENGEALQSQTAPSGAVGYQRGKVSLEYSDRSKFYDVPAIYEGTFIMTVGTDGKPVLKLVDVEYDRPFSFAPAPEPEPIPEMDVVDGKYVLKSDNKTESAKTEAPDKKAAK